MERVSSLLDADVGEQVNVCPRASEVGINIKR